MAIQPSHCPFCESHDLRTLYRDAHLSTHHCHDCRHTFHVHEEPSGPGELRDRGTIERPPDSRKGP